MGKRAVFSLLFLFFLLPSIDLPSIARDDGSVDGLLFLVEDQAGGGIELLSGLPIELYLRIPPYYLMSVPPAQVRAIGERGFTLRGMDRVDAGESLFLLARPSGTEPGNPPSAGEVLFRGDRWFLVSAERNAVSQFGREGFRVSTVPLRPLPLDISRDNGPLIVGNASLSPGARQKAASSDSTILSYLQRLQDFQTRYSYTDSVVAAAEWIYGRFIEFGFTDVVYDSFWFDGTWQRNVIATKPGRIDPDKVILIGGHYDSAVYSDTCSPYTWAPGVDDDGSGTALTLDLARILSGEEIDRTLKFVTFAAEEQGLYGSWHLAEEAYNSGMDIELMINMDMVGNLDDSYLDVNINTDDQSMAYAELMSQVALDSTDLIPFIHYSGWGSDHYPFMQYGFNHVYAEEGDFSPNWHHCSDIVDNIDVPYMVQVEEMVLPTIIMVANSKAIDVEMYCSVDSIARGESLPFNVTVTNRTDSTITSNLTLWIERVGGWEIPFFGPVTITLDSGEEVIRNPSIGVPDNAPMGDYIVSLEARSLAGDLLDEDSFTVTVVVAAGATVDGEGEFLLEGL